MNSTNSLQSEREVQQAQASREELVERLACAIRDDGTAEPLPGLRRRRASAPTGLGHGVSFPSFCVIAQGSSVSRRCVTWNICEQAPANVSFKERCSSRSLVAPVCPCWYSRCVGGRQPFESTDFNRTLICIRDGRIARTVGRRDISTINRQKGALDVLLHPL